MKNICINTTCFPNEDNSYYGGVFIKRELEELKKYFRKVYVIVPTAFGSIECQKCADYKYDNVEVYFPKYGQIPINFFRKRSSNKHIKCIQKVIKEHNISFDLIYSHVMWQGGYVGTKLKKIYNVPVVVVGHGSDIRIPLTTKNIWLKDKLDYTMKNADTVIINHEELLELLLDDYEEYIGKIKFIYKGINLNIFTGNKEKDLDNFVVLFVGSLNDFKDPITFIEAANILINILQKTDIKFNIVGTGILEKKCKMLVKQYNLDSYISFYGAVSNVEEHYKNCDVFCALSPIENIWSTTLQEALCMDKPCIVTETEYSKRLLTHEQDAFLIPSKQSAKLAESILKIKSDIKLRDKLSNTKWKKEFNIEKIVMKLYTLMRITKCH